MTDEKPRVQTNIDGSYRIDAWSNSASGMGVTGYDKAKYGSFSYYGSMIDRATLSKMYRYDWLARKICERPAHDAVRRWINTEDETAKQELERLRAKKKFRTAIAWARLYGGAAVIPILDDGLSPSEPLDPSRVKKIIDLRVFDRHYLQPVGKINDAFDISFGEPVAYTTNNGTIFHHSRVLKFTGADLTFDESESEQYWGGSFVELYIDAIRQFQESSQDIRQILTESSLGMLKIPGLTNSVAMGGTILDAITKRMNHFNLSKSLYRTAAMDAEEEYDYKQRQLAGLADLLDRFMTQVAGATDMTQLVLFGTTPGGLNSSQEEQLAVYYDMVRGVQEDDLMPAMNTVMQCINRGNLPDWDYCPLMAPSDKEKAEIRNTEAQAVAAISSVAMLPPEAITEHLNKTGYFNLPEGAIEELEPDDDQSS